MGPVLGKLMSSPGLLLMVGATIDEGFSNKGNAREEELLRRTAWAQVLEEELFRVLL